MIDFLYSLTNFPLFLLISFITISVAVLGVLLIHHYIPLEARYSENEALGPMSAAVCVLYAVLTGFTAFYILGNFSDAQIAAQREADMLAGIYHDTLWMKEPLRSEIQKELREYIEVVVNDEWPVMAKNEKVGRHGDLIISKIAYTLKHPDYISDGKFFSPYKVLNNLEGLYDARHQRISMANVALGSDIWTVILIGSFLTVAVNFPLGIRRRLHIAMIIAVALTVASMLFLLVALDRPFRGEFSIKPTMLTSVLETMAADATRASINVPRPDA